MPTELDQAVSWLVASSKTIALTGAGVSTESGIPDFRSPGGLWTRFNPMEYATLGAFRRDPEKVWKLFAELQSLLDARPNPGHRALAELEAAGGLAGIITQNIDGLHQAAGSKRVVEYHGSPRTLHCLACGTGYAASDIETLGVPPRCTHQVGGQVCGAILKPDVVLYDEGIPLEAMRGTAELLNGAELILVIGTSCETYPAGALPQQVRASGGRIVEINMEPARGLSPDVRLLGKFSEIMPEVVAGFKARRQGFPS